ncbi:Serine-pyruvate aminotransferase [archaeon HR06]|nr:Serine-pyruvate aminotransferase [archaeon HR06]
MGFKPFPVKDLRSYTVLAFWHKEGIDDVKFREYLDKKYGVIIAGGFGEVRGKVFRIGSMGIVNRQHVIKTLSSMVKAFKDLGFTLEEKAINLARAKLRELKKDV